MRLCICISGQLRGEFKSLISLSNQLKEISKDVDITIIISTWDKSGSKIDGALRYNQFTRIFEEQVCRVIPLSTYGANFWNFFPLTRSVAQKYNKEVTEKTLLNLFPDAFIDIEKEVMDLEFNNQTPDANSKKMLYKIWRCNEIKKKLEKVNKFDVVLRMRPDVEFLFKNIFFEEGAILQGNIYLPNPNAHPGVYNDELAYSDSRGMDIYCELFKNTFNNKWQRVHYELFQHIEKSKYNVLNCHHIQHKGLEENIYKLSLCDIKDDIHIFNVIKSIELSELSEVEIYKYVNFNTNNNIDRISLLHFFICDIEKVGNFHLALKLLLDAEFSTFDVGNFIVDRGLFLKIKLIEFCSEALLVDLPKLETYIDNQIWEKNIQALIGDNTVHQFLCLNVLSHYSMNNDYQKLIEINLKVEIYEPLADIYRDSAINVEKANVLTALRLMEIAQRHRPQGTFILNKLTEYNQILKMDKLNEKISG